LIRTYNKVLKVLETSSSQSATNSHTIQQTNNLPINIKKWTIRTTKNEKLKSNQINRKIMQIFFSTPFQNFIEKWKFSWKSSELYQKNCCNSFWISINAIMDENAHLSFFTSDFAKDNLLQTGLDFFLHKLVVFWGGYFGSVWCSISKTFNKLSEPFSNAQYYHIVIHCMVWLFV
jgi:hypothetical protein